MFITQTNSEININDTLKISIDDFLILEPNLEMLPDGYECRIYYPNKVHEINGKGLITIKRELPWVDGDRYILRLQDFQNLLKVKQQKDKTNEENLKNELEKQLDYKQRRMLQYPKIEQLVVEMWEHLIEGVELKDTNIPLIIEKRKSVKAKIPKKSTKRNSSK